MKRYYFTLFCALLISLNSFAQNEEIDELNISEKIGAAEKLWSEGENYKCIDSYLDLLYHSSIIPDTSKFKIYDLLSQHLLYSGLYLEALEMREQWLEIHPEKETDPTAGYFTLPYFYTSIDNYDTALYFIKRRLSDLTKTDNPSDWRNKVISLHNAGYFHYKNQQADSAEVYYNRVLEEKDLESKFPEMYGSTMGNMGKLLIQKRKPKEALRLLREDTTFTKTKIPLSYDDALLTMTEAYIQLDNKEEAEKCMALFYQQQNVKTELQLRACKISSEMHAEQGNFEMAQEYMNKYAILKDSIQDFNKTLRPLTSKFRHLQFYLIQEELDQTKEEITMAEKKAADEAFQFKLYIILSVSGIVLIIALIQYKNFLTRRKAKKQSVIPPVN